ncbi:MAG: NUDIX hydrolase [Bacteroidota bacterium]
MKTEPKNYKILSHENIFRGRVFNVIVDNIEYDSGAKGVREVAQHPGGAVVIGLFPDETILLVRQFRFAVDAWLWELPAGKLDPGENPLDAARREFQEETGYSAGSVRKLAQIHTTPGFCTEILHIYMATGLTKNIEGQKLEEGEQTLTVHQIPLHKTIEMIEQGEITDSKTICGIFLTERILHKQ